MGKPKEKQSTGTFRGWIRGERGYAAVLAVVSAVLGAVLAWGLPAVFDSFGGENRTGLVGVGLEGFGQGDRAAEGTYSPDLVGYADNFVLKNDGTSTVQVIAVRFELDGDSFPVAFDSTDNCDGGPFDLEPGEQVAMQVFVHKLTGEVLEQALGNYDGTFFAVESDGSNIPIATGGDSDAELGDLDDLAIACGEVAG